MAVSAIGASALSSPIAIQAQATEFRDVESNTRRVPPFDESRSTQRDARTLTGDRTDQGRPGRSGHSSKTATSGPQGDGAEQLSRKESANAHGARETAARPTRHTGHNDTGFRSGNPSSTVGEALADKGGSQIVARIEIRNPVFDRQKSNLFIDRLDEVRTKGTLAPSEQETRETSQASTLKEASEVTSGRFNKTA